MERTVKHWYNNDWTDHDDAVSDVTTETGISGWSAATQPAGGRRSPDAWSRGQTTLTTFGDGGGSITPRRATAAAKDQAQATSSPGARRSSNSDERSVRSNSADVGGPECCVVAVHGELPDDVAEQCRCSKRGLLAMNDGDEVHFDEDSGAGGRTSKNAGRTVPAGEGPCPPVPIRGCTDHVRGPNSSLNRKPKMVVKPNCDQALATPAALRRYYGTTSGRHPSKRLQTGSGPAEREDRDLINADCGTGVPVNVPPSFSAAASNLTRTNTLPSRNSRRAAEQSAVAETSSPRQSDVTDTRPTYAPRLFFADAGGTKAHGNAAAEYRDASYQNGFVGDNEKSAINRSSAAATPTSYGCDGRDDQIDGRISTSGGFAGGSGDFEVVYDGRAGRRRRCDCLSAGDGCVCRLIVSALTSLAAGCLVLFAALCQLRCSLPVAVGVSVTSSSALLVMLLLSRRCRCVVALAVPAVSTDRGRVGVVLLIVAALLSGPVVNVEFNVREMARSMTCSADVTYNQTLLLLQVTILLAQGRKFLSSLYR